MSDNTTTEHNESRAFDWCVRAGWFGEDQRTEWTERAVGALSSVSTGPHNIYGGWLAPQSAMDGLIDDGRFADVEGLDGHPIETYDRNRAVVMRCTNPLRETFLSRLSGETSWRVEVDATSGVARGEWTGYTPDDYELVGRDAIITPEGLMYYTRPFLTVALRRAAS